MLTANEQLKKNSIDYYKEEYLKNHTIDYSFIEKLPKTLNDCLKPIEVS